MRQFVVLGGGNFAGVFAQFGRDEIQLQLRIYLFFGASGDTPFTLQGSQRVYIEREPHVVRAPAQRHVVLFRAREIQQGGAKVFFFEQPDVNLQPVLKREAHLVLSMRQRLIDPAKRKDMLGKRVHVFLRGVPIGKRNEQIQIANCFLASTQRTRRSNRLDRLSGLFNMRDQRGRGVFGGTKEESSRGFLEHFHGLENVLFAFFAEAGQVAKFSFSRKLFHVRHGPGLEVRPQKRHLLRSKRLQLQQIQNRRRIFLQELLAQRVVAGLNDFLQVLDHAVADSRKFLKLLRFLDQLFDGFRQRVDQFGGLFVTSVPPDDRAVNFQELRGLAQDSSNLFVIHVGRSSDPIDLQRPA